jgi:hypothetical protein
MKDTLVNALNGLEGSEIESEELTVLEMEEVIRVRKRTVEAGVTVCLLETKVYLVGQWMVNLFKMVMRIGAILSIMT